VGYLVWNNLKTALEKRNWNDFLYSFYRKISQYSPTDTSKANDRQVNRRNNIKFDPKQTIDILKLGDPPEVLSEEQRKELVKKYLEVTLWILSFIKFITSFKILSGGVKIIRAIQQRRLLILSRDCLLVKICFVFVSVQRTHEQNRPRRRRRRWGSCQRTRRRRQHGHNNSSHNNSSQEGVESQLRDSIKIFQQAKQARRRCLSARPSRTGEVGSSGSSAGFPQVSTAATTTAAATSRAAESEGPTTIALDKGGCSCCHGCRLRRNRKPDSRSWNRGNGAGRKRRRGRLRRRVRRRWGWRPDRPDVKACLDKFGSVEEFFF